MCSQAAFPASPSAMPGSDEARRMTATSGRICLSASTQSGPLGLWLRTLVESSRWSSRARYLRWECRGLFSVRKTLFEDTNCERPLPLNASATTLRRTDMPSSRCLFRLVPLERRTDGTVCSSSEEEETILLQTPTTVQTDEPPERMRERAERNGYKNGTKFGSLTSQIKYDERVALMLKTPCAMDCSGDTRKSKGVSGTSGTLAQEIASGYATRVRGLEIPMLLPTPLVVEREYPERVEALRATGATKINSRANGEQRPNGIVDFMNFYGMLPTPQTTDYNTGLSPEAKEAKLERYKDKGIVPSGTYQLRQLAIEGKLPTPAARDYKQDIVDEKLAKRAETHQVGMPEVIATAMSQEQDGGSPFRLSPLFTEEMMGFPFLWTTLPFLRPSGAPKPSKPTATP